MSRIFLHSITAAAVALTAIVGASFAFAADDFPLAGTYTQNVACKGDGTDAAADQVNGPGLCGTGVATQPQPNGLNGLPVDGRCGPGTRVPFLVISPYAKTNFVSHTRISQASVVRFIEDNWLHGERLGGGSLDASAGSIMDMFDFDRGLANEVFLDPSAGTVIVSVPEGHHRF